MLVIACPGAGAGGSGGDDGTDDGGGTSSEPRPEVKESVSEIYPGSTGSDPDYFAGFNGELYFNATDDTTGYELWKYDGSSASRVADISSGDSSDPDSLIVYDGALYFEAEDGTTGRTLFRYNGSTVTAVDDSFSNFRDPAVFNDKLFFQGNANDGTGSELISYDGTTVTQEANINTTGSSFPQDLFARDTTLYFYAENGSYGAELWKYTESGGAEIEAYRANPTDLLPRSLTWFDGTLYFGAAGTDTSGTDFELWYRDSEISNPSSRAQLVEEVYASGEGNVNELVVFEGNLYFTGYEGYSFGTNFIYRSDGSTVTRLDNIVTSDGTQYRPDYLTVYDGALYFSATHPDSGDELWRYDGTDAELVWDINEGSDSSHPYSLYVHDQKLFFGADDGSRGYELFYYQSPEL
jgi:ELWxxDGT repeat protein